MTTEHKDKSSSSELMPFQYNDYYELETEENLIISPTAVKLSDNGIKLVFEYNAYKYNYQTKELKCGVSQENLWEHIEGEIKQHDGMDSSDEIRTPLLLNEGHSVPIVYVKKDGKEAILVLDSLGTTTDALYIQQQLKKVFPEREVPVYIPPPRQKRQRDFYSCHTEAQFFFSTLTGRDDKGNFLTPEIFTQLAANELVGPDQVKWRGEESSLHAVKLFDRLLLTNQSNKLRQDYGIVHNEEFLKRYPPLASETNLRHHDTSFLYEKGLKYSRIIEIQFYVNQLKDILGEQQFTKSIRDKFISDAKAIIKAESTVTYIDQIKKGSESGLFQLAQNYVNNTVLEDLTQSSSNTSEVIQHQVSFKNELTKLHNNPNSEPDLTDITKNTP